MEKKYRIKSEYIHLFAEDWESDVLTFAQWNERASLTLNALEEVEGRIEVFIEDKKESFYTNSLKKTHKDWTEQERDLIEFVVNEFESVEDLKNRKYRFIDILDFIKYLHRIRFDYDKNNKGVYAHFTDFLEQRKH